MRTVSTTRPEQRLSACRQRKQRPRYRRPLYLSAREARALAVLSGTSPFALDNARRTKTDDVERALFARLGRFLRAF